MKTMFAAKAIKKRLRYLKSSVLGCLDNDFAAKVRWRMRHDKNPLYITLADKLSVKKYAGLKGVNVAETLYITKNPETIPFDTLPRRCFIKANHGSGRNILCSDGELYLFGSGRHIVDFRLSYSEIDCPAEHMISKEECIKICKKWLGRKLFRFEWAFKHVEPQVYVEEALLPRDGQELKDYRMYTFDGTVKAINAGSPGYRRNRLNVFLRPDWQPFLLTKYKEQLPDPLPERPESLGAMIDIAEKLGKGIDFVRIDLFDTINGVVLGEITVYPEAGMRKTPTGCPEFNRWLREQWV